MGVLAHRPLEKLHGTARALQFFQQDHLMYIIAGQTIRSSDEHAIDLCTVDGIA